MSSSFSSCTYVPLASIEQKRQQVLLTTDRTSCSRKDIDIFEVEEGDQILGFKNATTCCRLKCDVFDFVQGERVFVKMGESAVQCEYSCKCNKWMASLDNMPSVRAAVVFDCSFSNEWWTDYAERTNTKWCKRMMMTMRSRLKHGAVPMQICSEFKGERLQKAFSNKSNDPRFQTTKFGQTLAHAILFSKRVGASDLGPYNMMVDEQGAVLQVDFNFASPKQISKYNDKGLQTSHKFHANLWAHARNYVENNQHEVASFLRELVSVVPMYEGVECKMFSETTISQFASNHANINELGW